MVPAMPPLQLQLLGSLLPSQVIDAPTRTRSKPLSLTDDRHRAALQKLLHGPTPLAQVARAAGTLDEQGLVSELRALDLDVQIVMVPSPVEGGAATDMVMVCCLTKRDTRKVLQHIKKQERKNG